MSENTGQPGNTPTDATGSRPGLHPRATDALAWTRRYELVATAAQQVAYERDAAQGTMQWGGSSRAVLGYDRAELGGGVTQWIEAIHPADRAEALRAWEAAQQTRTPYDVHYRFRHRAGHFVRIHDFGVFDTAAGDSPGLVGTMTVLAERGSPVTARGADLAGPDPQPRTASDVALRQSEERFRSIIQNSFDIVVIIGRDGRVCYESPSAARVLGFAPGDLIGLTPLSFVHPDDLALVSKRLEDVVNFTKQGSPTPFRCRRADGTWIRLEGLGNNQFDNPSIQGVILTARDITERTAAEEALAKSESLLRTVVENIPFEFWARDTAGYCIMENAVLRQHWGSLLGKRPEDAQVSPAELATWQANNRRAFEGAVVEGEVEYVVDGRKRVYWNIIAPIRVGTEIRGILGLNIDISERKRSEEERERLQAQLIQAQKMEAVGQLAGGVAHDFNNILAAILMYLDVLRSDRQLQGEMQIVLNELEDAANRAAGLTRQLLVFSRRQVLQKQLLEVDALLGNLTKMLRRLIGEDISLEFKNASQPLWVDADGGMLEQVVMNLVVNARDAMPKGGRITLMTRRVQVEESCRGRNPESRPGQFVCLSVSDTGCGMDDHTLKHIFEPFFTTKDVGKGTGLGLATVYGIVKKHDGWVEVESTPGQGSAFHVYLPASLGGPTSVLGHESRQAAPGGRETLLLVEDDVVLRRQTVSVLQNAGYRVFEAADGQEALTVWKREAGQFDLLLTDMIMPEGLTGLELAKLLRKEKAGLKVVLISGYNIEFTQDGLPTKHHISYLPKPFKASALAWTVRRCLDTQ